VIGRHPDVQGERVRVGMGRQPLLQLLCVTGFGDHVTSSGHEQLPDSFADENGIVDDDHLRPVTVTGSPRPDHHSAASRAPLR
jgi:hypothetical protein